jgi:hypothetical protein
MNALLLGGAVAVVMAGPPLYALVEAGQLDSSTAVGRGLLVAGVAAVGVSYVLSLVRDYEKEGERKAKRAALMKAMAEAEQAAKRHQDAVAAAEASKSSKPS